MKRLRIAMVGTKGIPAKWGGIEKYVEEVGKRLVQRGHEVTVFGSRWYCRGDADKTYLGIKIRAVPTLHLQSADALSNAFLSSRLISKGDYDIVHFHGYASYYSIPYVRRSGKRTVVTAHGVESGWDNPKYGFIARRVIEGAFTRGMARADVVTTVAAHLRERIKARFDVDSLVVPSGIDEEASSPPRLIRQKYGLQGEDYVLFMGRIDPIKRVEWIVDLSAVLDGSVKVVIAGGPQDSASMKYYRELRKRAGNETRCIFTGPVFGQEKKELLSNCALFVTASQNEGLPISLLEALSLGKCSVSSDIAGHTEVIDDGLSGFLFDAGNKEALFLRASQVLGFSRAELHAIGKAAKERVSQVFNWDRSTGLLEEAYRVALDRTAVGK